MNKCQTCEEDIVLDGLGSQCLVVKTTEWDSYDDGFKQIWLRINYCPECGKKVSDNESIS